MNVSVLTKKTTILFDPKMYRQLEQVAGKQGVSVAHLVRQAAIQRYLLPDRKTRRQALEAIAAMQLPVGEWSQMEREIGEGSLGKS